MSNNNQCMKCRHSVKDREIGIIKSCNIAEKINKPFLLVLGFSGQCPKHEYPEYYGVK